jgi:Arm DNA-binding domain
LWRLTYRYGGKQKLLSGGEHPVIKLAEARKWRDEARAHLFAGRDPSQVRKTEIKARAAESANAFEIVARPAGFLCQA